MTVSAKQPLIKISKEIWKGYKVGNTVKIWYLSDCGRKREWLNQKCKVEEDHRIFAERPFSYGYLFWYIYIIKHIGIKVLLVMMNWKLCKFILVARSHVWLPVKSCDWEEEDYNISIWGQPWLLFSLAPQLKCSFSEQSCKELYSFYQHFNCFFCRHFSFEKSKRCAS